MLSYRNHYLPQVLMWIYIFFNLTVLILLLTIEYMGPVFSINPFKPSVLYGTWANSAEPDQRPQNVASDQVLHCLLTEIL